MHAIVFVAVYERERGRERERLSANSPNVMQITSSGPVLREQGHWLEYLAPLNVLWGSKFAYCDWILIIIYIFLEGAMWCGWLERDWKGEKQHKESEGVNENGCSCVGFWEILWRRVFVMLAFSSGYSVTDFFPCKKRIQLLYSHQKMFFFSP